GSAAGPRRRLSGRWRSAAAISAGCRLSSAAAWRSIELSSANRSPPSLQSITSGVRRRPVRLRLLASAIVATSQANGSGAGVMPTSTPLSPRPRRPISSRWTSRSPARSSNWRRLIDPRRRRTPSVSISPTRPAPTTTRRRPTATTNPLTLGGRPPRSSTTSTTWPTSAPSAPIRGRRVTRLTYTMRSDTQRNVDRDGRPRDGLHSAEIPPDLREAEAVPGRIAETGIDPVRTLLRVLGELDAAALELLVLGADVIGGQEHRAGEALRHQILDLFGRVRVHHGRAGDRHQHDRDVLLTGRPDRQPAEVAHLGQRDV